MGNGLTQRSLSIFELLTEIAPNERAAREFLEHLRWPEERYCLHCGVIGESIARGGDREGYYRCRACRGEFTIRTASVFERSHIPLQKWVYTMYILVVARKGISARRLARELGAFSTSCTAT